FINTKKSFVIYPVFIENCCLHASINKLQKMKALFVLMVFYPLAAPYNVPVKPCIKEYPANLTASMFYGVWYLSVLMPDYMPGDYMGVIEYVRKFDTYTERTDICSSNITGYSRERLGDGGENPIPSTVDLPGEWVIGYNNSIPFLSILYHTPFRRLGVCNIIYFTEEYFFCYIEKSRQYRKQEGFLLIRTRKPCPHCFMEKELNKVAKDFCIEDFPKYAYYDLGNCNNIDCVGYEGYDQS
ncbi:hypothetical protein L9F63_021119, partial [Diploptera punctata]